MSTSSGSRLLVIGVGGLGRCMVNEALERGQDVSVLVRDRSRLEEQVGSGTVAKLAEVTVGDATDPVVLDSALVGIDVVLSGRGADPSVARELAAAVVRHPVRKICWPAGSTNVLAEDGETPNYRELLPTWPVAEQVYRTHQECIDLLEESGVTCVFFCPGKMGSAGHRSPGVAQTVRVNRDAGRFVSYEDAAWVMLEAALTDRYDNLRVSASTPGSDRSPRQ
ncbi:MULTISPECIES: NAD(P)H-binding protein [Corynebacterium]|uniref:NAD(P)H-binding protein n=1 Tax=Corynebacterium TaxID=1716 RepID=UPI00102FB511|nr:NAD(P)H-binding protein [Corynebacterium neomassiliense]MCI1257439.1 NAD(P)H-binding protein [Corynebacterium provencense]